MSGRKIGSKLEEEYCNMCSVYGFSNYMKMKIYILNRIEVLGHTLVETDYFMLMNGDSFLDLDGKDFLQHLSGSKAVMALAKVDDISRYGSVVLDENKRVSFFSEKGEHSGSGLINAGISLINKELFKEYCPDKLNFSIETEFFPRLVDAKQLLGFVENGTFIDIGVPDAYHKATQILYIE